MNLNLISLLIVSGLSLHVLAGKNGDRGSRWGSGQAGSTSPRTESAAPATYTPVPTTRYAAPQATERTFTPPQQAPAERTYTPSQTFKSEPTRTRNESFQAQEPQRQPQQRATVTPRQEQTVAPNVTRTQPVAQPTQPVTMPQQPIATPHTTSQGSRNAFERESRAQNTHTHQEREKTGLATTQPVVQPTQPAAIPRNTTHGVRSEPDRTSRVVPYTREHQKLEKPAVAQTQPVVQPTQPVVQPAQPAATPRGIQSSREIGTQRHEQTRSVQITPPRTDRRTTEKAHSPFIFEGKTTSRQEREREATRAPIMGTSPISQSQHQAVSLRSPQHADSRTREPDQYRTASAPLPVPVASRYPTRYPTYNNTYYAHHYPSHTDHHYRPVTSYNRSSSFWQAFGFTIGASLLAPLYIAPVVYPVRTSYGTTWYGSPVVVSVSTRRYYPTYAYRPYYCNTGYIHDGFHYSSAYYGGWRGSWYGGFSYIFNPTPVYSSYYLYDEPQTIVVQQPAPQVVTVNQPAQPVGPPQESILDAAPPTTQPQPALEPAAEAVAAQTPPVDENAHCFCACKCNGRVPCICEYACGSEFAYSPDEYTLKGFSSYAESLNAELIWSSYAGLDRAEPESLVAAGATEQ